MTELETRLIATNIVERLRAKGHQPFQIRVWPNGSGITARVGFQVPNDLVVQAIIPPGHFDYDRIAAAMDKQIKNAVIDSDGARA